jgi:hypothetical protein
MTLILRAAHFEHFEVTWLMASRFCMEHISFDVDDRDNKGRNEDTIV